MRKLLVMLAVGCLAVPALGTVYVDATGDTFTGAGGGILDISSVEVTNTATEISFKFTLMGDVVATDWGKYMVIIDRVPGGDTAGNGWGRPINMASGADNWIGSWVDSGNGAELYDYSGSWSLTEATYNAAPNNDISISKSGNMVTVTTLLSNMGLSNGSTFAFDAFTSGGGGSDGAVDSLGNPGVQIGDWGNPSSAFPQNYTVVVPEPASLCLLALGGFAVLRRRS